MTKTQRKQPHPVKLKPGAARAKRKAQRAAQDQRHYEQQHHAAREARREARRQARRTPRRQRQAARAVQALARSAAKAPKPPVALPVGTWPVEQLDQPHPLTAAGVPVPKRAHPERNPSKPLVIQRGHYAIFRDFNSHHCIRVDVGTKLVHFIPLDAAGLEVRTLSHDRFAQKYSEQCAYPLERAAQIFARLGNSAGYTAAVQQHLEAILNGSARATTKEQPVKTKGKKAAVAKHASPFDPARMVVKGNASGLAKARAAKGGKPTKVNDDLRYVVALNNTRSGHMKVFLDAAEKFGKRGFKRADLVAATKKALTEERATTYFGYCVYKKLFKAA